MKSTWINDNPELTSYWFFPNASLKLLGIKILVKWNLNSYSKQQSVSSSKPQEHGCVIKQTIMLNF